MDGQTWPGFRRIHIRLSGLAEHRLNHLPDIVSPSFPVFVFDFFASFRHRLYIPPNLTHYHSLIHLVICHFLHDAEPTLLSFSPRAPTCCNFICRRANHLLSLASRISLALPSLPFSLKQNSLVEARAARRS